ncbi:MAG: hypothetical protein WAM11_16430, partial [Cyanobium sp.]
RVWGTTGAWFGVTTPTSHGSLPTQWSETRSVAWLFGLVSVSQAAPTTPTPRTPTPTKPVTAHFAREPEITSTATTNPQKREKTTQKKSKILLGNRVSKSGRNNSFWLPAKPHRKTEGVFPSFRKRRQCRSENFSVPENPSQLLLS